MKYTELALDMDKKIETEGSCDERKELNVIVEIDDGKTSGEDRGIFGKSSNDKKYRHQIFHSICVCLCMFARGLMISMVGPTFPDLRIIIAKDLSTASWLFTAIYLGAMFGAICGGFAYDRFNRIVVFVIIMLGLGIFAGITPLCAHFVAMVTTLFLHGAFGSALDTAATADMIVIWRENSGPFVQAFHCAASVGYLIAPLVSKPFLTEKGFTENRTHISKWTNTSNISPKLYSNLSNYSDIINKSFTLPKYTSDGELHTEANKMYGKSNVFIPYMIGGFLCILALAFYLLVYYIYGNVYSSPPNSSTDGENSSLKKDYILTKKMKLAFTLIVSVILTEYLMIEQSLIGFLMTFTITKLEWSKAEGATLSSSLWTAFAIGRISGIFVVKCLNLSIILITFYIILNSGIILFWISVTYGMNILVWISVVLIGFGMSIIIASGFSWVSVNVRILTGKLTSILFVFMTAGAMVNPVILGNLMDRYTQLWMIYWLGILCATSFLLFIFVYFLFGVLKSRIVSNNDHILKPLQK